MGKPAVSEPETLGERSRLGHQSIALPLRGRVPVVGGSYFFRVGVFAPIQPDNTPVTIATGRHHENPLAVGLLDDLHAIAILELARPAGRKAIVHGIVLQEVSLANLVQSFGPGLERSPLAAVADIGQQTLAIHADGPGRV